MNPILAELTKPREGVGFCWLGNCGWLMAGGGRLIALDLAMEDSGRLTPAPVSAKEIAPLLDIMFVTHPHGDHFCEPTVKVLINESRCRFVLPVSCLAEAKRFGVPEDRVVVARPKEKLEVLGVKAEMTRAFHGHRQLTVQRAANMDDCGYLLNLAGLRILQPGDTLLTEDLLAVTNIDVLFVSPTEHNMWIEPAARWIHKVRPRHILPQHFGTYAITEKNDFWTRGYVDELRAALDPEMQSRYHVPVQGEIFTATKQPDAADVRIG